MSDSVLTAYMALVPKMDKSEESAFMLKMDDLAGKASDKIKHGFTAAFKAAAAIGKDVLSGVADIAKQSLEAFANYEQLAGGVETLFKDSADIVMEYANRAFETAGLSANEYMETVTGFSASLLQSVGGDTEQAARIADMAIQDMSDNANKMGTSMESIQAAYQGFAKQNYTMLDNLKLGYGGTKSEMERLLRDAEELSGIHYDISNLDDVYSAIHVIQGELDITGTTAKESASTIEGSLKATKASWQNLLVGLANDEASLDSLVQTFLDNVITFAQNALPRLTIIVESIGEMLPDMIDMVIAYMETDLLPLLESMINTLLDHIPDFIQAGVTLLMAIIKDLPNIIINLVNKLPDIIDSLVSALTDPDNIMLFLDAGWQLFMGLAEGIKNAIPRLIKTALDGLGSLVDSCLSWLGIKSPSRVFMEIGDYTMQGFAKGIEDNADLPVDAMRDAVDGMVTSASAQVEIMPQIASQAAGGGISIANLNLNCDSSDTADIIFNRIRQAAAMA